MEPGKVEIDVKGLTKRIIDFLVENLPRDRYEHTIRVAMAAEELGKLNGCNLIKVKLAALLHDVAKGFPSSKLQKMAEEYGIEVDELEYMNSALLHSKVGAEMAKQLFGITDEDILQAIRWHTTGRPNMSILEKIIFVADFIEPGRDIPQVEKISIIAQESLDKAVALIAAEKIKWVVHNLRPIHPKTIETYNFYVMMKNIS